MTDSRSPHPARGILLRLGAAVTTVLALTLPLAALPATAASSAATVGDLVYSYDAGQVDAGATVTGDVGGATAIAVPDTVTIDGTDYDVTAIGEAAFRRRELTGLTLGNNVTTIGDFAFSHNPLTSLTIPDSVTTIGTGAFHRNDLTSLTIPDGVTTIGEAAFYDNRLTSLTLGNGLSAIGHSVFSYNQLTGLTIPDGVATIGDFAFYENRLANLTIADSVTTIGEYAFYGNVLNGLTIPGGIATIGDFTFASNRLTSLTIPASVTTLGDYAFGENPLTDVSVLGSGSITLSDADELGPFGHEPGLSIRPECAHAADFGNPWHGYPVATATSSVVFAMGGRGAAVAPQQPECGQPATAPEPPTEAGWLFAGWYADGDRLRRFDFADPISTATTLYAGWAQAPTLTGDTAATFTVGEAATWAPDTVTGSPAPTLRAEGLPDGLEIDESTGAIGGTPTTAGNHTVTVTADNGIDPAATLILQLTVRSTVVTFTMQTDHNSYQRGDPIIVTGGGLPGGARVPITLHSDPVELGTATVAADGRFALTATIPPETGLGGHRVIATAVINGQTLTQSIAITVSATPAPAPSPDPGPGPDPGDSDAETPTVAALPDTGAGPGSTVLGILGLLLLAAGITTLIARRPRA